MPLRGSLAVEARFALWTGMAVAATALATRVLIGGETSVILGVAAVLYLALMLGMQRLVGSLRAQVAATQEIALHDGLTSLPNRVLFRDRAEHAIRGAARAGDKLAVMLLDLDKFKEINDTLGHEKGDRFLVEVASRLQLSLRASDTIARLGGDEFGLVVPVADTGDAQRVAARLLGELERPFEVGDLSLRAKGSIGIALFPDDGSDTETLLRKADVAMYAGKQVHLPVLYSAEHDHYSPERLLLIGELKRAIEENELVVHYQPVVDVVHGSVKGLEALVRWQHPERGLISPAQFVVFAEQTGLMELLTEAVLRIALPQCAAWRADGHEVVVAVNVSGRDLGDRTFPTRVAALLDEAGLEPGALEFEITEDTLLADPLRTLTVLEHLREVGVRLAVDDFGAGRTSLHYLRKLRVDALKIDRSFVLDLLVDPDNQAIVRSTVELAHRLGLEVVAEGVETADTLDLLAGYGCDLAQGHLFSRPVPAEQLDLAALAFGSRR